MRILVTGGAGFIGSHLCMRLLKDGHEVTCLDNLYTGRKENLEECLADPHFKLIRHDVQEPIWVEVDQIYHLSCPASPRHYQHDPVYTLKTAFIGTLNVLELARQLQIRVLIASTSEVYGDPLINPQAEDYWGNVNPVGVRSCYDEGKRAAETLATDYRRCFGSDIRITRIFNTYGPNMCPDDGRVVSNFIVQALKHEPITVYGDGSQTRSFCYVDDLVEALVRVMAADHPNGPINLGNPNECTVLDLAKAVLELTASSSPIRFLPLPADDPVRRQPDISRARTLLRWQPRMSLLEGLGLTVAYFRQLLITELKVSG